MGLATESGSLDPSTCVAVAHWWRSDRDLGAPLDSRSPGWQRAVYEITTQDTYARVRARKTDSARGALGGEA
jgi:hypothetical protein